LPRNDQAYFETLKQKIVAMMQQSYPGINPSKEPITNNTIEVRLLLDGESPVTGLCDAKGSFRLKTDKSLVRLVISTPYYRSDTIVRILKKLNQEEIVSLHANDYALMIHYFSTMKVDD
jgi:hypothetical protein